MIEVLAGVFRGILGVIGLLAFGLLYTGLLGAAGAFVYRKYREFRGEPTKAELSDRVALLEHEVERVERDGRGSRGPDADD